MRPSVILVSFLIAVRDDNNLDLGRCRYPEPTKTGEQRRGNLGRSVGLGWFSGMTFDQTQIGGDHAAANKWGLGVWGPEVVLGRSLAAPLLGMRPSPLLERSWVNSGDVVDADSASGVQDAQKVDWISR